MHRRTLRLDYYLPHIIDYLNFTGDVIHTRADYNYDDNLALPAPPDELFKIIRLSLQEREGGRCLRFMCLPTWFRGRHNIVVAPPEVPGEADHDILRPLVDKLPEMKEQDWWVVFAGDPRSTAIVHKWSPTINLLRVSYPPKVLPWRLVSAPVALARRTRDEILVPQGLKPQEYLPFFGAMYERSRQPGASDWYTQAAECLVQGGFAIGDPEVWRTMLARRVLRQWHGVVRDAVGNPRPLWPLSMTQRGGCQSERDALEKH
ncbi:unnamed protein product [Vitrella brassicaformis CCMP3155]|uniref:Uncharacterized protein n=1 Tax=Vitrella brassicaformis (strain CCMP3155) TaxID=1169540 RepID=A0A0G4EUI5_VITBC|nr:unnamed protein product [Vitrella brassicaformis CCMP3155]|eukprot:CEM01751.1 unnamed protein product [Vitrella brassicaformis CCMP3155]